MTTSSHLSRFIGTTAICALWLGAPAPVHAHCDGLDGPVVKAAQHALEMRDPAPALAWVQEKDEPEIRAAFDRTLAVRGLGPDARELADRYFFETLVRLHRAGEGAPFTGLKPAGRDLGPAIPASDEALERGTIQPVATLLGDAVQSGLRARFTEAVTAKSYAPDDIAAGREYVRAYVEFIHYVERLYEAATTSAHGHFDESEPSEAHR